MRKITILLILLSFSFLLTIRANADIHYVSQAGNDLDGLSWASAKHSINAAITNAVSGDQVWVKAGTYNEISTVLLKEGVSIYGGFTGTETDLTQRFAFPRTQPDSNATIIDGTSLNDSVIRAQTGITNSTSIDGFTIRNGIGRLAATGNRYGGGIDCNGGSPTIINNRIVSNTAAYGAGIYSYGISPIITDNNISENHATRMGSGMMIFGGTIQNNVIEYNQDPACLYGAGIYVGTNSYATSIIGNTIRHNITYDVGGGNIGGAVFSGACSNLNISSNIIDSNESKYAAGIYCLNSNAVIDNNEISNNVIPSTYSTVHGLGVYSKNSNTILTSNLITDNTLNAIGDSYGGAYYAEYSSSLIDRNIISSNSGGSKGGGLYIAYQTTVDGFENAIRSNMIYSNTSSYGSGIYLKSSSPSITNNTICSNIANSGGSVEIAMSTGVGFNNNIVAFNSSGISLDATSTATLNNNDFHLNTGYNYYPSSLPNSDISVDPLFKDISGGDYHLLLNSPCKDAGNDSYVQTGWLDIDGQNRINLTHVDIGADEIYQLPTPEFSPVAGSYNAIQNVSISCSGANIYYTTNGSTPTKFSSLYTNPIVVNASMTIKAIACKSDYADSEIGSAQYTINPPEPPDNLTAVSTGSGKITLYWDAAIGATGYNVYRGTTSGGENYTSPINGGTPVNTESYSGSGVYIFTNTGLTNGTEYFYTVKAVGLTGVSQASDESSDITDPNGIPWDSSNPSAVLSAIRASYSNDPPEGLLRVAGPDGRIYEDGQSTVLLPDGIWIPDTNKVLMSDGSINSLPDVSESVITGMITILNVPEHQGPYRRVRTTASYTGVTGEIYVPTAGNVFVNRNATYSDGEPTTDDIYILLGSTGSGEVDAGLQWSQVGTTKNGWNPFMLSYPRHKPIINIPTSPRFTFDQYLTLTYRSRTTYPGYKSSVSLITIDSIDQDLIRSYGVYSVYKPNEIVRVKRMHSIAQARYGAFRSGSYIQGVSWRSGQVRKSNGVWTPWTFAMTNENGSSPVKGSIVNWFETSPYVAEDSIKVDLR